MELTDLKDIDNLLYQRLVILMSTAKVLPDGSVIETKQLVEQINDIKIHIFSNEHAPPHFHAKTSEFDACFSIKDCKLIEGHIPPNKHKIIKYWYKNYNVRDRLISIWNKTRPSNCQVGLIVE